MVIFIQYIYCIKITIIFIYSDIIPDINECDLRTDDCSQVCTNEEPGYSCSCNEGFTFNADGVSCDGKQYYPSEIMSHVTKNNLPLNGFPSSSKEIGLLFAKRKDTN